MIIYKFEERRSFRTLNFDPLGLGKWLLFFGNRLGEFQAQRASFEGGFGFGEFLEEFQLRSLI